MNVPKSVWLVSGGRGEGDTGHWPPVPPGGETVFEPPENVLQGPTKRTTSETPLSPENVGQKKKKISKGMKIHHCNVEKMMENFERKQKSEQCELPVSVIQGHCLTGPSKDYLIL